MFAVIPLKKTLTFHYVNLPEVAVGFPPYPMAIDSITGGPAYQVL